MKICINRLINLHTEIKGLNTRWCRKCDDKIQKSCIYANLINIQKMEVKNETQNCKKMA